MKKLLLIFFTLLICRNFAFAVVDVQKISINEAVEIAKEQNLDVQAARLNIQIEENNIKTANKLQNPSFGVFYNFGKAGKGNPQQIGASQIIEIAKRKSRKEHAKANYDFIKNNVDYFEFDLKMDVREAYTNLLAKKSILTTMLQQEDLLKKLNEQAKIKYRTGEVSEIDVLQSQLLLNQIITEVNAAKYDEKTALFEFNKVINCKDGFYDTLEESFTEDYKPLLIPKPNTQMPDFDSISTKAINNRFDIKIALSAVSAAEKELNEVLRKRIPDLEITAGYGYQNPGQSGEGVFKHGAFAGANLVNIPLLYNYSPEIKNARLKLKQANLNYYSVENKALNDVKKAYERFLTAQFNIRNYNDQLLDNSEEFIKASRKSYKDGKTDLTTLITMEEAYRMISIAYTNALADYYNAWNAFIREVNNETFTVEEENL